ncbi:YecA family protein [Desulfobacula sp.]|uniref:YecA family protein n=1 Tax=Desulfobacula sp. TaxID=2593537 RepID=UPI0039B983BC
MLFNKNENTGKVIATLLKDGNAHTYECFFSSCDNPACTCGSIDVDLNPLLGQNRNGRPLSSHRIDIDLIEKKLNSASENKISPEDLEFANLFWAQLNDDDFDFLFKKHFAYKNHITETADTDSINAFFDYEAVEQEGLMYAYNDVLPYGDQMHVTINNEDCLIFDQFCLLPKCSCSDTILDIVPIKEIDKESEPLCALTLKYNKKRWETAENFSPSIKLETIRHAIEEQQPDFYKRLHTRHEKLKSIYLSCRQKNYLPLQPAKTLKVGRNDPCPCGSGKKHKKCCL